MLFSRRLQALIKLDSRPYGKRSNGISNDAAEATSRKEQLMPQSFHIKNLEWRWRESEPFLPVPKINPKDRLPRFLQKSDTQLHYWGAFRNCSRQGNDQLKLAAFAWSAVDLHSSANGCESLAHAEEAEAS